MGFKENLRKLRKEAGISQSKLSEKLNVTPQSVQKWESGESNPDIENLIKLSVFFNVSADRLLFDSSKRQEEELMGNKSLTPAYSELFVWELYSEQLDVEYRQCLEEGLDIEEYKELFLTVSKMPKSKYKADISDVIFDIILNSKLRKDYKYSEPNNLNEIKKLRANVSHEAVPYCKENIREKIEGAWYGRICGCLLGKPVEGKRTDWLHPFLKETNNFPMYRYIKSADITEEISDKYNYSANNPCFSDISTCMPVDDDTNYTVLYQLLIEKFGKNFTPYDVSRFWMDMQPKNAYCTAERVAFKNFVEGFVPPESASYKNPYREWIGAQIRGDYFGYINPGDPEKAADMALRDASISHVKNGIYGEMFAAAMIAKAAVTDDIIEIIEAGINEIPECSRLYEAIANIIKEYKEGKAKEDCFKGIHTRWDEFDQHHWCHTISNAEIVAASLLYGEGNFGKSICMAVETGFDTDCNGATVGSVLGMRNGINSIDKKWIDATHGLLDTSIFGVGKVSIDSRIELNLKHLI